MDLQKAVRLFLGQHKPTTEYAYRHALHPLRDWIGGDHTLASITPALLIEYVNGHILKRPPGQRPFSPATQRKLVRTIRIFFNWCVKMEMLRRSPARHLELPKENPDLTRDKAMTDAELAALLDYFRQRPYPRDYALLVFLRDSGARRGGAAGLRLRDMQWDDLTADVKEKGDLWRKVAYSEGCARAIRHWLMWRGDHYRIKGEYVFSRDGLKPDAQIFTVAFHRACAKLGLRPLGPHTVRHRLGFKLNDAGYSLTVSATVLGNTPEVMRDYYSPRDWASAETAARALMPGGERDAGKSNVITFPADSAAQG